MGNIKPKLMLDDVTGKLKYQHWRGNNHGVYVNERPDDGRFVFSTFLNDVDLLKDLRELLDLEIADDLSFDPREATKYYRTRGPDDNNNISVRIFANSPFAMIVGDEVRNLKMVHCSNIGPERGACNHLLAETIKAWYQTYDTTREHCIKIIYSIGNLDKPFEHEDLSDKVKLDLEQIYVWSVTIEYDDFTCGVLYYPELNLTDGGKLISINGELTEAIACKGWLILCDIPYSVKTAVYPHKFEMLVDYVMERMGKK